MIWYSVMQYYTIVSIQLDSVVVLAFSCDHCFMIDNGWTFPFSLSYEEKKITILLLGDTNTRIWDCTERKLFDLIHGYVPQLCNGMFHGKYIVYLTVLMINKPCTKILIDFYGYLISLFRL